MLNIDKNVMHYKEKGTWQRIEKPSLEQVYKGVKVIPPGAVFVIEGAGWISRMIGLWGLICNFWRALKMGFKVWASHTGNYWGSGNHKTIEAFARGVDVGNFMSYMNKKNKVIVWYNKNVTVENLMLAKEWDYQQVGKKYDYRAFVNFVLKGLGEEKDAFICTEIVGDKVKLYGVAFLDKPTYDIHPIDIVEFMGKREGGWEPVFKWNWEE